MDSWLSQLVFHILLQTRSLKDGVPWHLRIDKLIDYSGPILGFLGLTKDTADCKADTADAVFTVTSSGIVRCVDPASSLCESVMQLSHIHRKYFLVSCFSLIYFTADDFYLFFAQTSWKKCMHTPFLCIVTIFFQHLYGLFFTLTKKLYEPNFVLSTAFFLCRKLIYLCYTWHDMFYNCQTNKWLQCTWRRTCNTLQQFYIPQYSVYTVLCSVLPSCMFAITFLIYCSELCCAHNFMCSINCR